MDEPLILTLNKFYGGMVRDDKSRIRGGASNVEEIDIFSNEHYIQAEQILSADALPASTEAYAYTADLDDNVWLYGKETAANKVRLLKVTTGGADNPGAVSTVFTSADATDIAYSVSPIAYHRQDNGNKNFLYYCTNASGTVKLKSYDITGGTESETDAGGTAMTLTKLDASYDRISFRRIAGELFITNGQYISKVDKDGVFTEDAFTLPNGAEAVDIIGVSDVALILSRDINRLSNQSMGYWWDLTTTAQFDDSFDLPMGGPQWIENFRERILMFCSINGRGRFFQLQQAVPGAVPIQLPGIELTNCAADAATQPISSSKMLAKKENVLYFGLNKTDKTGIYAIGQLDEDKNYAVTLSKRFHTSDYSLHKPTALLIQGPNFYAAFSDNGTASTMRCESNNSPTRSSNAVYESIWIDADEPAKDKDILSAYVTSYPLAASTSVALSIATDYSASYTAVTRPDSTTFNSANGLLGFFRPAAFKGKKVFKIKLALTSSTTNSPKVTTVTLKVKVDEEHAQS